jgi:hypothetical protein
VIGDRSALAAVAAATARTVRRAVAQTATPFTSGA